ncbi:MAG: hypothetical protein ACTSYI_13805 [Promethearchaeota archaeon]
MKEPTKEHMNEQGCLVNCVFCSYILPNLKGNDQCPYCHGNSLYFKPMHMMDRSTANRQLLHEIFSQDSPDLYSMQESYAVNLLTKIEAHNFDLKQALIDFLKELVMQKEQKEQK